MTRGAPKITRTRIRQRQLQNAHGSTRRGVQRRGQRHSGKEIKGPGEFTIHFVFAQGFSQDKMQDMIHPAKSFAVSEEFHEQGGTAENGHAGNKLVSGGEMIQAGKENTKRSVHDFAAQVAAVAVLQECQTKQTAKRDNR